MQMPSKSRWWCACAVACTLVQPSLAMAAPPQWSADGSAEAATLRERALVQHSAASGDASGRRGVAYDKTAVFGPSAPDTQADLGEPSPIPEPVISDEAGLEASDLQRRYELERIAKRGRSFFIPGVVLVTLGTLFVLGSIGGLASQANAVTGGLMGGSLAISAIGWPLLVVGVRMRKHPERYLKNQATARVTGGGLRIAF